jgi:hypothetical protein
MGKHTIHKYGFDPTRRLLAAMGISAASAVNLIREDMERNPVARKFIEWWDKLENNKRRCGRIDLCCREAKIPADEIRGIIVRMWVNYHQELATVIQLNAMPELVRVSTDAAMEADNYEERLKHLESRGIVTAPREGGIHVTTNVAQLSPPQEQRGLPDFDEHLKQMSSGQKQIPESVDADWEEVRSDG